MPQKEKPGLRLFDEGDGRFRKYLVDDDGTVLLDRIVSPHDELIDFMDKPMKAYYEKIRVLEEHTLFQESIDVSVGDFTDLINTAFAIAEGLREEFPEAYYFTETALADALLDPDDGDANYLIYTGARILKAIQMPYITKVRMRNIMEVCFGTTEDFTQEERYAKTCAVYPVLHEHTFLVRWVPAVENGWRCEYEIRSLFELYAFELLAALQSERRIVRCQHCWNYFVPLTKKKTDYCYRLWPDGKTCGVHGANLKRHDGPAEDRYLAAYKKMRARLYERDYREYANEHTRRGATYVCFEDWMEVAGAARLAYLADDIDGDEFLRRLNPDNEPLELAAENEKEPLPLSESWRELVEQNMNFEPDAYFEDMLFLDLRPDKPDWRAFSAAERASAAKKGDVSLREKYGKGK